MLRAVGREIYRNSGITVEDFSIQNRATELTQVEGLVIHDHNDEVAPVTEGRAIAEAWGARFVETHGLGHKLQSKSVAEIILGFLRLENG